MRRFCQRRCRLLLLVTRNWPHVHSASEEEVGSESDPSDAEVVPDPPELLLVSLSLLPCAGADLGRRTLDLRRRLPATVRSDSLLASLELLSLPLELPLELLSSDTMRASAGSHSAATRTTMPLALQ